MDKKMTEKLKKAGAATLAVGLGVATGVGGMVAIGDNSLPVSVQEQLDNYSLQVSELNDSLETANSYIVELESRTPETITEFVNVTVEVPVEVEVPVDNGNLQLVLDHIYDNNGEVSYLLEDLDDDEVSLIADRIVFVNDVKSMAVGKVKVDGLDELDNEEFTFGNNTVEFDEGDIERFKVYDDSEDVVIDSIDFDDSDAVVLVSARFEQDDVKYKAVFEVEIKDGRVDDISLVEVVLRD